MILKKNSVFRIPTEPFWRLSQIPVHDFLRIFPNIAQRVLTKFCSEFSQLDIRNLNLQHCFSLSRDSYILTRVHDRHNNKPRKHPITIIISRIISSPIASEWNCFIVKKSISQPKGAWFQAETKCAKQTRKLQLFQPLRSRNGVAVFQQDHFHIFPPNRYMDGRWRRLGTRTTPH